jgi:hypothetical protein
MGLDRSKLLFFLLCFVFVLLSVGEVLLVHARHNKSGADVARKIRCTTCSLLAPAFVAVVLTFSYMLLD